jgi:hypothetical protein
MPVKLTKIKRLCLDTKVCKLSVAIDGSKWIGDGRHYFRLVGIDVDGDKPEDALDELLGFSDKSADKMRHPVEERREPFFRRDGQIFGETLELRGVAVGYGVHVWVLEGAEVAVYVEEAAIEATRAADRTVDFRLVRMENGQPMVAVICGLFCDALLRPAAPAAAEQIRQNLEDMGDIRVMDYVDDESERGAM